MSSFYENKKNKIIEKKITLRKKNNSSSEQWILENKEIPLNYTLRSTFSKPNSKYFQNENKGNLTKIENTKIATKSLNNITQNTKEDESLNCKIKKNINNIKNGTRNIYINGNKINKYVYNKKRNESYTNFSVNNKSIKWENAQTPIKTTYHISNVKPISQSKRSDTNYKNTTISKNLNSTNDFSNKTRYMNNSSESNMNQISSLYKNHRNTKSCCFLKNKNKEGMNDISINNITKFDDELLLQNKLYNNSYCDKTGYNCIKNNISKYIIYDTPKKIENKGIVLDFNNTNNYIDLCSTIITNDKNPYKKNDKYKKENINIIDNNQRTISLDLYGKSINNKNNIFGNKTKNISKYKHILFNKNKLSSFLLNTNSKIRKESNENEDKKEINKYIFKKVKKTYNCINLKEKINKERYNLSLSKRKSKVININNDMEYTFVKNENDKGGRINLNLNDITNFKLFSQEKHKKNTDLQKLNIKHINAIIKLQKLIKFNFKLKNIIYIQKAVKKFLCNQYNKNNKGSNVNNIIFKKPLMLKKKCEIITKDYKCNKYIKKIIFIQKYYIEYLSKKKNNFTKIINNCCYMTKKYKTEKIRNITFLQRHIKKYLKNKNLFHKKVDNFDTNNLEASSSMNLRNFNYKKFQKNIPNNSYQRRNTDLVNIESKNISSYSKIESEYESNNNKINSINKNESINSLYLNYQIKQSKKSVKIKINNNSNTKSRNNICLNQRNESSEDYVMSETEHNIPKFGISKISKFNKGNNNLEERYKEFSNIDSNINNNKDIFFDSIIYSFDKSKINLKVIFLRSVNIKLIKTFLLVKERFYLIKFILILSQRISKYINQYAFFYLLNIYTSHHLLNDKFKASIFFNTIKRLEILNNEKNNIISNDLRIFIKNNIPICLNNNTKGKQFYIPYINTSIEQKLINMQLFPNINNSIDSKKKLSTFIQNFIKSEKNKSISLYSIISYMIKNKLHNSNIFTIIRYIDSFYDILNNNVACEINCLNEQKEPEYNFQENIYILNKDKFASNNTIYYSNFNSNMYEISNDFDICEEKNNENDLKAINEIVSLNSESSSKILVEKDSHDIDILSSNEKYNGKVNENDFWNNDDIIVTNNKVINKGSDCISKINDNTDNIIKRSKIHEIANYLNRNKRIENP